MPIFALKENPACKQLVRAVKQAVKRSVYSAKALAPAGGTSSDASSALDASSRF
eukprot:IDg6399t1